MLRYALALILTSGLSLSAAAPARTSSSQAPAAKPAAKTTVVKSLRPIKPVMDTVQIHRKYLDGDFDQAIAMIEQSLSLDGPFSHDDSVFIFKHLGVMYAAKYDTREKGKFYMVQLLQVEPTARIMDMYASDMIYMIFKNIQDEHEMTQAKLKRAQGHMEGNKQPTTGRPGQQDTARTFVRPTGKRPAEKEKKTSYAWMGWTAAALATAGGVAVAVHVMDEDVATKVPREMK